MITLLLHLLRLLPFLVGGHRQLALENLALRHQLAIYKRTVTRPRLRRTDRFFWIGLARVWAGWRQALVIVTPDTVLRWQRRRFREYWTKLSARPTGGRPPVHAGIRALVTRMATANPSGAPRESMGNSLSSASMWPNAPSPDSSRSGPPRPPRRGGRSSPTMSETWSPSISSRCQPLACGCSSSSSCSPTIAAASSTSM